MGSTHAAASAQVSWCAAKSAAAGGVAGWLEPGKQIFCAGAGIGFWVAVLIRSITSTRVKKGAYQS